MISPRHDTTWKEVASQMMLRKARLRPLLSPAGTWYLNWQADGNRTGRGLFCLIDSQHASQAFTSHKSSGCDDLRLCSLSCLVL